MAITNLQACNFVKDHQRQIARDVVRLVARCKLLQQVWTNQGLAALLPNETGNLVQDGADLRGFPLLDGAEANVIKARIDTIAGLDAGQFMAVLYKATEVIA